jgi:ribosomal protein S18 acetylase RimI-like enzyme
MITIARVTPDMAKAGLPPIGPDVFDDVLNPDAVLVFVEREDHVLVVAIDDLHGIIGQCVGYLLLDVLGQTSLYIDNLGVTPTQQRNGIARRLVNHCQDIAREHGCTTAWLVTEPDNEPAVRLYRAIGANESPTVMFSLAEH